VTILRALFGSSLAAVFFLAPSARAQDVLVHATVAGAHAIGEPQSHELGYGIVGNADVELLLAKVFGIQAELGGAWLPQTNPPTDPTIAAHGDGTYFSAMLGVRLHPFGATQPAGLWIDLNGGYVLTGSASRAGIDTHLGYDFRLGSRSRWDIGPFVGYTDVIQPSDSLRPQDAHILSVGVQLSLGAPPPIPPRLDTDRDGVFDDEDACLTIPGVRTTDPKTNGCPPDRDGDGIPDTLDACPDTPGVATNDPKTNGCPPDRDHDGIPDAVDACPDKPGVATTDPKTNGCPADRDHDGVPDADDACPDEAGPQRADAATNGCAEKQIHIERDQIVINDVILFDFNNALVAYASFPLLQRLAKFIEAHPEIVKVSIEGHADDQGGAEYNKRLSTTRANSVRNMLIHFGIPPERLTAVGWGQERPIDLGHDEAARQKNRRVEFIVTRQRLDDAGGK
jgi:OmpA-OmpF porin, OOP family